MAVSVHTSVLLGIDIVLAGFDPGDTVLTVPNPEGGELLVPRSFMRRITADTTGADERASLDVYFDASQQYGFTVEGALADATTSVNTTAIIWPAASSLILKLRDGEGFEAAETFTGKLFVEYLVGKSRRIGYRSRIPVLPRV